MGADDGHVSSEDDGSGAGEIILVAFVAPLVVVLSCFVVVGATARIVVGSDLGASRAGAGASIAVGCTTTFVAVDAIASIRLVVTAVVTVAIEAESRRLRQDIWLSSLSFFS